MKRRRFVRHSGHGAREHFDLQACVDVFDVSPLEPDSDDDSPAKAVSIGPGDRQCPLPGASQSCRQTERDFPEMPVKKLEKLSEIIYQQNNTLLTAREGILLGRDRTKLYTAHRFKLGQVRPRSKAIFQGAQYDARQRLAYKARQKDQSS